MPRMPYRSYAPPAFCPTHGLFPANQFPISPNSVGQTIIGSKQLCPTCGHPSEIIPGIYNHTPSGLNILLDPSISPEALQALKSIAEKFQRNEISAEEAQRAAEAVVPGTGKLFDVKNWSDIAQATLAASIIGAIGIVAAAGINATKTGDSHTHNVHVSLQDPSLSDQGNTPTRVPRKKPGHPDEPTKAPTPKPKPVQ